MQIVPYLLFIVLAIFTLRHKKDAPYGRMVFGSILGIFFFFLWPLVDYYADLKDWTELYKQIVQFCFFSFTIPITRILLNFPYEEITGKLSLATFFIFALVYFSFEIDLKNSIAFNSDYFKNAPARTPAVINATDVQLFKHPAGGYQLSLPKKWHLKSDKTEWFPYYQLIINNKVHAELRPMCFPKEKALLAGVGGSKTDTGSSFESQCYREGDSFYYCKEYQINKDNQAERIQLLGMNKHIPIGIKLDFVLSVDNTKIRQDIDLIMHSVARSGLPAQTQLCLSLAEWF